MLCALDRCLKDKDVLALSVLSVLLTQIGDVKFVFF